MRSGIQAVQPFFNSNGSALHHSLRYSKFDCRIRFECSLLVGTSPRGSIERPHWNRDTRKGCRETAGDCWQTDGESVALNQINTNWPNEGAGNVKWKPYNVKFDDYL
ncbi:MAG: hypothetical protein ACI9R3_002975 [Verrucomicrobiales bacterium]|jgi:hypothetical protein